MKFNRLGAFTLGVVITAASVGAVSYVNAAGNGTLKACANKTTGAMRYISKGSCKKTETSLSWNQVGPQGLPGSAGANGSGLFVVDANGKTLGLAIGDGEGIGNNPQFLTLTEGRLWLFGSDKYNVSGRGQLTEFFSDASCQSPVGVTYGATAATEISSQVVFGTTLNEGKLYRPTTRFGNGNGYIAGDFYVGGGGSCTLGPSSWRLRYVGSPLWNLEPVTPPTYTAPLSIVAK